MRQKANKAALLSPTSPGKADEVTVTTPVKETIQSPTGSDIPNELAQSNEVMIYVTIHFTHSVLLILRFIKSSTDVGSYIVCISAVR